MSWRCAGCGVLSPKKKKSCDCPTNVVFCIRDGQTVCEWKIEDMKPIPISAAKRIAEDYDYDQVVVIARKVGDEGGEHCTTYGVDEANCAVAARIGDFLKYKVMGWLREGFVYVPEEPTDEMVDAALRATATHLDIKGSQLTVNREKMRVRWRAMLDQTKAKKGEVRC